MTSPSSARTQVTLDNGLKVILQEKHDAPVASFWTFYRVGSRNEIPGLTGVSHWCEHMQFKGTPSIPKGTIFGDFSRIGGHINALTSMDWTGYYETIPSDQLDLSLRIESDRMENSLFDPDEVASERTVILSERQGAENRPTYHLYEELIGSAFHIHPYGHSVIGYESDLRSMSRNDLYHHYRRYYRPDNAFITAVGDFDADELLHRIQETFGRIPAGEDELPRVAQEGPQRAERRITLKRPSAAAYLMMGYKLPPANHPDIPAVMVADALLSGAKTMGLGGGGGMGHSSRLYKALVTTGLARSAGSSASPNKDEWLWTFNATALPGVETGRIEDAFETEIERLKHESPSEEEFIKARKQIRAQYVYSRETVTAQAYWLGNMEIVDHVGRIDTYEDEFAAVTPDDVQRVAKKYLTPESRTIGWQLPVNDTSPGAAAPVLLEDMPAFMPTEFGQDGSASNSQGFVRAELANRIVVLAQPRPGDGAVNCAIRMEAGQLATGDSTPGLASMTGEMLTEGTSNRTKEQIDEELDSLGAMLGSGGDKRDIEVSFHALTEDLDHLFDIAADVIRNPTFPEAELNRVRQSALTSIREMDENTGTMAADAVNEIISPADSMRRFRAIGTSESVESMSTDALAAYHQAYLGPALTIISIVGGIDNLDDALARIERVFGDWGKDVPAPRPQETVDPPAETTRLFKDVAGKSQSDIAMAFPTIPRDHPDYYAVMMANLILGQLGLMGRLGANVRDKQGLAYYATSSFSGGVTNSFWNSRAGVDPSNIERAIDGIIGELERIREDLVEQTEIDDAKSFLIGSLPLSLEALGGVTDLLLNIERYGLGLDYIDRYPEIIRRLTREGLRDAIQRHVDPARLAIGIAGPATS